MRRTSVGKCRECDRANYVAEPERCDEEYQVCYALIGGVWDGSEPEICDVCVTKCTALPFAAH